MASLDERREDEEIKLDAVGICHSCTHRIGLYTCEAFPHGIPYPILTGNFLHIDPYPGDGGIRYERMIRGV